MSPVEKWLQHLGLGRYAPDFEANAVDWDLLPELDQQTLIAIGVTVVGHRIRILRAVRALRDEASDPTSDAASPGAVERVVPVSTTGVTTWSRTPGERKPVTMLFADIVGSTALTEQLDSEETHELLYGAARRMCDVVEANDGTVCRFMGDGVMAMFGAPVASEHHALQACRAALEMQVRVGEYAMELNALHNIELQARVGMHSGEVVVLEVGDDPRHPRYDASGPTVPLAARMEQAASPGCILMTEDTRGLVGGLVDTDEHAPLSVKGFSRPMAAHVLKEIRAGGDFENGPGVSFVGRLAERAQFRGVLEACLQSRHGQIVLIRGEAGIGKTRLIGQFRHMAEEFGFQSHTGLVLDFGAGKGQDPIGALVRSFLNISSGGGKEERRQALSLAEAAGLVDAGQLLFFTDILNLPRSDEQRAIYEAMDNKGRTDGRREAVRGLLTRRAATDPVLILIEDLHWADTSSLGDLCSLVGVVEHAPIVVAMTYRERDGAWESGWRSRIGRCAALTMDVGPLREGEAFELAAMLVDAEDDAVQHCVARAAGNPLFLEQLLRNLHEGAGEDLPDSIRSLLLARLDRLPTLDKSALRVASVLGQRFEVDALRNLLGVESYGCGHLVLANYLRSDGSGFLFCHSLFREGIYASMLREQRRELHRRASAWYAQRDRILCAEHLERAEDHKAPIAYEQASRHEFGQHRFERATMLAERGLALCRTDADRTRINLLLGELAVNLGRPGTAIEAFKQVRAAASGVVTQCRALIGLAQGYRLNEGHEELLEALDAAEPMARRGGLIDDLARVTQLRSNVHFMRGEFEACLRTGLASLEHARAGRSPALEAQALSTLGDAEYARGRMVAAYGYYDRCIELSRRHKLFALESSNLSQHGDTLFYQLRFSQALADAESAVQLASRIRNPRSELLPLTTAVFVHLDIRGDTQTARPLMERCLNLAREIGSRALEAWGLIWLARIDRVRGDPARAIGNLRTALQICNAGVMHFCGPIALGTLALTTADPDRRRSALAEAEDVLNAGALSHCHLWFYRDAIEVSLIDGDWQAVERYAQAMQGYCSAEPLPWSEFFAARGRVLAAFGQGDRRESNLRVIRRLCGTAESTGMNTDLPALKQALARY